MPDKSAGLSLLRKILRAGRRWSGPKEEQLYIVNEARTQFRAHIDAPEDQVADLVTAGEQRLEYAEHYGIPYPRQHHASQFYRRQYLETPEQSEGAAVSGAGSADAASKLAAALARRRQKQEGQKSDG